MFCKTFNSENVDIKSNIRTFSQKLQNAAKYKIS